MNGFLLCWKLLKIKSLYQGVSIAICQGLKHIQENMAEIPANVMLAVPLIFETMHKKVMKTAAKNGLEKKIRKGIKLSNRLKLYNRGDVTKKLFAPVHEVFGNSIEIFIAGGAAIDPKVIEDFQAMGFPMIQGYGMTENAPIIAVNKDCYSKPNAAGLPMPGTEIRIEDPDDNGVGEIIIKGPSVMLGYYENEEATNEAIVDGWLKTGDYGYSREPLTRGMSVCIPIPNSIFADAGLYCKVCGADVTSNSSAFGKIPFSSFCPTL